MSAPEKSLLTINGRTDPIEAWIGSDSTIIENIAAHLHKGYGFSKADANAHAAKMEIQTDDNGQKYVTNASLSQRVASEFIAPPQGDRTGKGNFAGGYTQLDKQHISAGPVDDSGASIDEKTASEVWETTPFADYGTREWDNYGAALDFALEANNIPFDDSMSLAEKRQLWRDSGLPPISIEPGEFGGFTIQSAEAPAATAGGVITTDQGMYQQGADGEWSALDMGSAPASMEYMGGMLWMRGTDGSLAPVNNLLERMVEQKILEGDWETALQWDDFRNRPSPQEHLQSMLEYARTPADQVLLSAIARGYAEGLVPPQAGSLARVGPIPKEATEAWERYERSITGGPAREEMEEFLASEQAGREEDKAEYFQSMTDMRNAFSDTVKDIEKSNQETMKNFVKQVSDGFAKFGTQITDLTGTIGKIGTDTTGSDTTGSDTTGSDTTGSGAAGNGNVVDLGTTEGKLDSLKQEWSNQYQGQHPPQGDMSDEDFLAWLQDKNNWPLTAAEQKAADEQEALKKEPPEELTRLQEEFETASGMVAGLGDQGETPASVFGVQSDLVDWGSDDTFYGTDDSIAESQYVYQQADPDWSMAGEGEDKSWQETYFAPQVAAEQKAIETGQTEGMAGFEAGLWEGAEGGIVQGPTFALLGEKESEVVVPFSKIEAFRRGELPVKNQKITETGSRVSEFAEGGLVFGPEEIESRGGAGNVGAVPGYTDVKDPRYITNETLEGIRSGTLLQNPDDPYDIYSAGGRETDTTKRLDAAQAAEMAKPASFEESLANVSGGERGNLPIGVQQVLGGRSPRPLGGRLLNQAGMTLPSAQAWRNLSSDERAVYTDLARRSGITEGYLESEMQSATPSGGGGARRGRMLPLASRRIFR
jgi:hypothetical protein